MCRKYANMNNIFYGKASIFSSDGQCVSDETAMREGRRGANESQYYFFHEGVFLIKTAKCYLCAKEEL